MSSPPLSFTRQSLDSSPNGPMPRWVRYGLWIVFLVYIAYSCFGIAGPYLWGHFGYHGATYVLRARMTLRFHMLTPATWPGFVVPPLPQSFYFHHPIGYHHVLTPFLLLLGDHDYVGHLVAALGGLVCLFALFQMVRRHVGDVAALIATAVYVALPIVCSFSILIDAMLLAMACCILTMDSYLQYLKTPTTKWLVRGCLGLCLGGLLMWEAYFQAFFLGLHCIALFFMGRKLAGPIPRSTPVRWFLTTFVVSSLTMAFHFFLMWQKRAFDDFRASFHSRSTATFAYAKAQHEKWLLLLYGKPILFLGGLWLVVFLIRLCVGKSRQRDFGVLLFFLINTLYIFLFPAASSIHLYRVFWYSTFFALAISDLACDLYRLIQFSVDKWIPRDSQRHTHLAIPAIAVTACLVGYFALVIPHSYRNLLESRVMMGTHGEPHYDPQYEKLRFAEEASRLTEKTSCFVAYNLPHRLEFEYYLDRSFCTPQTWGNIGTLTQVEALHKQFPNMVIVMDSQVEGAERAILLDLLRRHPGTLFGTYLHIDLGKQEKTLDAFRFVPHRPSLAWRYLVSHKYPPLVPEKASSPILDRFLIELGRTSVRH